jgi:exonuclease SbcC
VVRRLKEARKQQAAAERAAKSAAAALAAAETAHEKARKQLDKAREERLRGIAAELAASLEDGEPCPVCGSTEHPLPARPARGVATAEKIAALEKQAAEAEKALKTAQRDESKAQSAVAAAAREVETLQKSLEKAAAGSSVTRLESQLTRQRAAYESAREASRRLRDVRETVQALTRRLKEAQARLNSATNDEAAAQKKAASARARVEELEGLVEKPLRAAGALEKAIIRQEKTLKHLDAALQAARDRLARAEKQHAVCEQKVKSAKAERDKREAAAVKAQAELEQRLKKAGFASEKDYQASIMSARDMEKLAGELRRYDEAVVAARDRLRKAAEAAKGLKAPDLPSLRTACDEARQAIQHCDTQIGSLRTALKQLADVTKKLDEIAKRLAAREREHQRVQRLADLASGRSPANPGFHRFVLGYRLDEVLLHANGRLATMSGGRYRLQRPTEARGKRELQAGLNLVVLDGYTGKVRPVETLSGGETFVAALALALGLSDAVQSLAGGIRLDTVFIDEGFGSLDSDALDRAMEALLLLREGGRLVGIISHVAELRERIRNTRLEVTTAHGASQARLVLA